MASMTKPRLTMPTPCIRRDRRAGRPQASGNVARTAVQNAFTSASIAAASPSPVAGSRKRYSAPSLMLCSSIFSTELSLTTPSGVVGAWISRRSGEPAHLQLGRQGPEGCGQQFVDQPLGQGLGRVDQDELGPLVGVAVGDERRDA